MTQGRITRSQEVWNLVHSCQYKKALKIAKSFRIGITETERDVMTRAYECYVHPDFYRSIGVDVPAAIREGIYVLRKKYSGSKEDDLYEK